MERKLRTIVCGSTFGQFYLEALKLQENEFEVVGLLAKGSERSKKCASNYNVKLYSEVDELPDDIDLACVVLRSSVLGGCGTDLTIKLMERGIHVIQEHPLHPKDLEKCYRLAKKNNVFFQTGNLYANLPEVKKFIECAKAVNQIQKPAYINAAFAAQVSYPAVEILMYAMPSIRDWEVHCVNKDSGPFHILTGLLGSTPVTLEIHNEVYPKDPDNHMYLLHNIVIVYECGRLTLEDTFGPTLWNPRLHVSVDMYERGQLQGEFPDYMLENTSEILGDYVHLSFKDTLTKLWPKAILEDLMSIRECICKGKSSAKKAQQEILCAKQWSEITKSLGYADIISNCAHNSVPSEMFKELASKYGG